MKMTELIKSYLNTAAIIKKRMDELAELMKNEKDIEKLKSLRLRRSLLEDERYEMLGVVSDMIRASVKKNASGDC
jgi:hypothetical protein